MKDTEHGRGDRVYRVDQICDSFEEAWRGGDAIPIEELTGVCDPSIRDELLRQLLLLEIDLRGEARERPTLEEYVGRFPADERLVRDAFRMLSKTEAGLGGGAEPTYTFTGAGPTPADAMGRAFGKYELLELLGRGGMGVVYKARDTELDRVVALKTIRSHIAADPEALYRFRTEARAVAQLKHPNVAQILEIGERPGEHGDAPVPFFALEFAEGGNLGDRLGGQPQPVRRSAEDVRTLAGAIQVAHDRGLVHRDLKPANVLIAGDGRLLITDFGLVRPVNASTGRTQTGAILGTPSYMAPEQASARRKEVGPRTDVYSLGAILYAMLTGRPPFRGESVIETIRQVQETEPVAPRALRPEIPRDLETVTLKCLAKEPGKRYPSAAALADDLGRWLEGKSIAARPVGPLSRAWRLCRRNPLVSGLTALLILAMIAGTAVSVFFAVEERRRADELQAALATGKASIDEYVDTVLEEELLRDTRFRPFREKLLSSALAYYQQYIRDHGDDPATRAELAEAVLRVAKISKRTLSSKEAIPAYRQARDVFERLCEDDPTPYRRWRLADIHNNLADLYFLTREPQATVLEEYDKAFAILNRLIEEQPDEPRVYTTLARTHGQIGVACFRGWGNPARALREYEAAESVLGDLIDRYPDEPSYRHDLAVTLGNKTNVLGAASPDEAARVNDRVLEIIDSLLEGDAENPDYRSVKVGALNFRGLILNVQRRPSEARLAFEESVSVARQLAEENVSVDAYQAILATSLNSRCGSYLDSRRWEEALGDALEATAIYRRLSRHDPGNVGHRVTAAVMLFNEANCLLRLRRFEEAVVKCDRAKADLDDLPENAKRDPRVMNALKNLPKIRAEALEALGRPGEAAAVRPGLLHGLRVPERRAGMNV